MSWLNDLSQALGIPTGGAVVAVSIYYVAVAAEKEARKEAIQDIARVMKSSTWSLGTSPNALVSSVFKLTFGDAQLSWRCVQRSMLATVLFCFFFGVAAYVWTGLPPIEGRYLTGLTAFIPVAITFFVSSFVPDYIALAKSRFLIQTIPSNVGLLVGTLYVVLDMFLSILISSVFCVAASMAYLAVTVGHAPSVGVMVNAIASALLVFKNHPVAFPAFDIFLASTLMTSIWLFLILTSYCLLKILLPLKYVRDFVNWFFPIEQHPIRAIGIVVGSLVWLGSVAVNLL